MIEEVNPNDTPLFRLRFDDMAVQMFAISSSKDFWDSSKPPSMDKIVAKLALIHSEVSELLEAMRKNKTDREVVEEFADILIRVLDLYGALSHYKILESSLEDIFDEKVGVNKRRPSMHGHSWG